MRIIEERFLDMLEAIQRIEKYAGRGRKAFVSDELIQTYIVHNLQILGEAAAKIPADQQIQYPDLPWPKMVGMRNVLVHHYFNIDLDIVWQVVENELPELKETLNRILENSLA
ncbi:MAG: DUF86 domain-containing protein [Negativicutes bacterium]